MDSHLQVWKAHESLDFWWAFTCECSQGKEEVGSSWPAEADSGCKVGDAAKEGTSRNRRCMEVEDLSSREKKWRLISSAWRSKLFICSVSRIFRKFAPLKKKMFNGATTPSSGWMLGLHSPTGRQKTKGEVMAAQSFCWPQRICLNKGTYIIHWNIKADEMKEKMNKSPLHKPRGVTSAKPHTFDTIVLIPMINLPNGRRGKGLLQNVQHWSEYLRRMQQKVEHHHNNQSTLYIYIYK